MFDVYAFATAIEVGQIASLAIGTDSEWCAPMVWQICPVSRLHRIEFATEVHNVHESLQFQGGIDSHGQRGSEHDESKIPK